MFKLDHQINTEKLFEFNRQFEESVIKWELDELWSRIIKCKQEYLQTKNRNLLFLLDFFLSQLINENDNNIQKLSELFNELFKCSHESPKNQWLLISLMKQYNLKIDQRIEKKIDLLITLNESSQLHETTKLIKYVERDPKDLDEDKLLIRLRQILKENPHLGALIIGQFNQFFRLDEQNCKLREYSNLNFLIAQSFKDVKEKNFFLICDFLNIIPDNDLASVDLAKILNDYELIFNETTNQPHLIERFYTAILGRDTDFLAYKLSELNWTQRKNKKSIDSILDSLYFILFDRRYLISELYLELPLDAFQKIPDRLKLFYLINKIYNLKKNFKTDNLDQFKYIVDNFNLKQIDRIDEFVVSKLKWIFKFLNWIKLKCDQNECGDYKLDFSLILDDLLNNASTLQILLKYNLLPILDEQIDDFSQDVMELIVDCKNKSELMLWKGKSLFVKDR